MIWIWMSGIQIVNIWHQLPAKYYLLIDLKKIQILDLGVGTGYLTHKIIEMFPNTSVVAIDAAGMMIDKAKIRLKAQLEQITFKISTFQELPDKGKDITGPDAVVSAFALHHLLREEKLKLFQYVHSILKPEGWFINCDIFNAVDPANEALYRRLLYKGTQERSRSRKNQEKSLDYIASEYTSKEKRDGDNPSFHYRRDPTPNRSRISHGRLFLERVPGSRIRWYKVRS